MPGRWPSWSAPNTVKSDSLAAISHELRTQLNIIVGYLSMISEGEFGPVLSAACDSVPSAAVRA